MLRDQKETYGIQGNATLSAANNHSLAILLSFIDRSIESFRPYYLSVADSDRENRISDFLVFYFNTALLSEKEGFPPFNFGKNPTQSQSTQETDLGVVVLTKNAPPVTIIEFEAKRFSDSSNNKEYVCGSRGGIERFKRNQHGAHLHLCGMFGYIQDAKYLNAAERVNAWIAELALNNSDDSIDWKPEEEKLVSDFDFKEVKKWKSLNTRKGFDDITLLHYHLNLS